MLIEESEICDGFSEGSVIVHLLGKNVAVVSRIRVFFNHEITFAYSLWVRVRVGLYLIQVQ